METLQPGTPIGPYVVEAPIGSGGMGEVYRARDGRLGRDVALKLLPASLASDGAALSRFEQEARAARLRRRPARRSAVAGDGARRRCLVAAPAAASRRAFVPFDPEAPVESFGIAPDGSRVAVSTVETRSFLLLAEGPEATAASTPPTP
jgi:hypothetical protein